MLLDDEALTADMLSHSLIFFDCCFLGESSTGRFLFDAALTVLLGLSTVESFGDCCTPDGTLPAAASLPCLDRSDCASLSFPAVSAGLRFFACLAAFDLVVGGMVPEMKAWFVRLGKELLTGLWGIYTNACALAEKRAVSAQRATTV